MYGTLALTPKAVEDYRPIAGDAALDELRELARPLRGLRVLHLSVTAFGTGVAEMLNGVVPLSNDAGLDCHWQVVRGAEESSAANKALYRALAGSGSEWTPEMSEVWLRYSAMNAELLTEPFDIIVVHDPQPAAIRSFAPQHARNNTKWVLHSHLDLSSAMPEAWELLSNHIDAFDAIAFDAAEFVHPDLASRDVRIIRPAIDPLGPRNMDLPDDAVRTILDRQGIDPARPMVCQISPPDPGSDALGAIDVFDAVRRDAPGLQLVLIASTPPEDALAIAYFDQTVRRSAEYRDVHILRGVTEVGNVEANAFQRASQVVLQKGLRRGFGIWVSDAQWKERPVVGARTVGLQQQVVDGETGYLADTTEVFAACVTRLLGDAGLRHRLGAAGKRHVADKFLLTRLLADQLRLFAQLTSGG